MTQPVVSFVIVTFENAETIYSCLDAIRACTESPFEVIVVDNSPGVETLAEIERFRLCHPAIPVSALRPGTNLGFGRACNLGASRAEGKYLFFLNPDTTLLNDAAASLTHCLESSPGAVAAGPSISDSDGRLTRTCRNLPTITRILADACGLDRWFGWYKLPLARHLAPSTVQQIIGAAILIRRGDFQRAGGMDEQFFVYFEEVDLCKRLLDAGGRIWYWPEARVQHLAGHSCEGGTSRGRMVFMLRESRKKYFLKHFGPAGALAMELINRLEALEKLFALSVLSAVRGASGDRAKLFAFWRIATGRAPKGWESNASSLGVHD